MHLVPCSYCSDNDKSSLTTHFKYQLHFSFLIYDLHAACLHVSLCLCHYSELNHHSLGFGLDDFLEVLTLVITNGDLIKTQSRLPLGLEKVEELL